MPGAQPKPGGLELYLAAAGTEPGAGDLDDEPGLVPAALGALVGPAQILGVLGLQEPRIPWALLEVRPGVFPLCARLCQISPAPNVVL